MTRVVWEKQKGNDDGAFHPTHTPHVVAGQALLLGKLVEALAQRNGLRLAAVVGLVQGRGVLLKGRRLGLVKTRKRGAAPGDGENVLALGLVERHVRPRRQVDRGLLVVRVVIKHTADVNQAQRVGLLFAQRGPEAVGGLVRGGRRRVRCCTVRVASVLLLVRLFQLVVQRILGCLLGLFPHHVVGCGQNIGPGGSRVKM